MGAVGGAACAGGGAEVGSGGGETGGVGVGLSAKAVGDMVLALGSAAGKAVLAPGSGKGDGEGNGVSSGAAVMVDSGRKHGLKGSLQQVELAGQVRAAERRSSRQMPPQQNVPLMQQSGLQGLLEAVPVSSWRAAAGGGALPVSTAKPLLSAEVPLKFPSVPMGSADAVSCGWLTGGNRRSAAQMLERFWQQPLGTSMQDSCGRAPPASQNVPQQNWPVGQQSGLHSSCASAAAAHANGVSILLLSAKDLLPR